MSQTKAQLVDPVDGTIVNADINASAAIAGSKISPSFTSDLTITDGSPAISFIDSDTDSDFRIIVNDGKIKIQDTTNSNAVRFLVDSSGRVGIAQTPVSEKLEVSGAIRSTSASANFSAGAEAVFMDFIPSDRGRIGTITGTGSARDLAFNIGNLEKMRIDTSGRLLVGTSSSRTAGGNTQKILQIETTDATAGISITRNSATSTASMLSFSKSRGTSNGTSTIVQDDDQLGMINFCGADGTDAVSAAAKIEAFGDGTPGSNDMPGRLIFSTTGDGSVSPTEAMRITSTGDLCVGTTTAVGKAEIATSASEIGLTVSNDTHDSYLQILATAANKNSAIFFGDNGDGNIGAIDYDHNINTLSFKVNGTEKARFDNTGDFGIGSSTINLQGTNRTTVSVNGTNEAALCFNRDDTITGFLFADSGEFRIQAEAGASNLVKIRNNNGTICQFDDDGIKFNNDTAAENGLADYERGTWTPALTSGFFSGETYTTQSGTYVKIGDQLTAWFYIRFNAMVTSGGEIRINSPFTMLTGSNHKGSGIVSYHDFSNASVSHTLAVYQKSSTDLKFYAGAGTLFSATAHTSQAGKYLIGFFTVRTP